MTDATPNSTIEEAREGLRQFPPALGQEFESALEQVQPVLEPDELAQWLREGLDIARHSLRSWEAASEYYRASASVLEQITYERMRDWCAVGIELMETSPALSGALFRASPQVLPHLSVSQADDWAAQGKSLYKGTWKSGSLSAQFFDVSPQILPHLPLSQMRLLVDLIDSLASHSYELASACLGMAPGVLSQLDRSDRAPFLEFGGIVAHTAWVDARVYFERGPGALRQVSEQQRPRYLSLSGQVATQVGRLGHPYFIEAAQALSEVDKEIHEGLLELAEQLAEHSGDAAMEFIKSSPRVADRLGIDDIARWQEFGLNVLQQSRDGGEAFFRLESARGEEVMEALSSRVDLDRVSELIRMYCKALTGVDVGVKASEELTAKGVGWVDESSPTTEGTTIYLPENVERYPTKDENFAVYKVFATHQAGRLEFGSFDYQAAADPALFPASENGLSNGQSDQAGQAGSNGSAPVSVEEGEGEIHTDMERFFDQFEDRRLAHDLFTIVEDTRIDTIVKREYAGVRRAFSRLQQAAIDRRRPIEDMPARQAMVENLLRASLDEVGRIRWPGELAEELRTPLRILNRIRQDGATVQDSAAATALLYNWLSQIPNMEMDSEDWSDFEQEMSGEPEAGDDSDMMPGSGSSGLEESFMPFMPGSEEQPYDSPDPVDFRGDFKPELVQLLMKLKGETGSGDAPPIPLTKEQLQELLEKSVEISINELMDMDLAESSGMFLDNLLKEVNQIQGERQEGQQAMGDDSTGAEDGAELPVEAQSFYYDEWDFRAADYKPRWCRVQEQRGESGTTNYYTETLHEHTQLVQETRKQFEMLRPEMFRKMKRLTDGEDYDLDAVIEWYTEKIAGGASETKLFYRRNKVDRDVAVAFLLDVSASTDEEIQKHHDQRQDDQFDDDPRKYLSWWAQRRAEAARHPGKRIIDLEKEAVVLLIEALETIGDKYGVYGFSGYGRDNVEFFVYKDMDEPFGDRIKERIDKIAPVRSTRMGPAIRHCIWKLQNTDAKVKILILLSDGRPQDHGYGRDRTEKEYAIHDTKMALTEARREGMVPFALTVDRAGHDYLKQMCQDMAYEVVADIESLPRRLPALYRRLTG